MSSASSLVDRVVIVTGGSRGIGREIVLALAEAGARVAIVATAESAHLEQTVKAAGGGERILPIIGDVRRQADCERVAQETLRTFGAIHVLFNNAALGTPTVVDSAKRSPVPFWQAEPESWLNLIDTNINGFFLMSRAVAATMLTQRFGKIVNISTSDRTMVRAKGSPYGPSKAFIEAASRIWAQDLEGTGVSVNVLLPGGAIDTSPSMVVGSSGGNFLPVSIMRAPALWLASDLANGHTAERFIAKKWDEKLPLEARVAAARDSTGELPRVM
ncbi:MAG: hypothetical protein QOD40_1049 [Alphaproteobacteria bacterium]|jgi:3-oxoacyl-[acyl-carrier protein] reductase|nr:hypothetical protein [Alphaproteobacteria bacterium]